MSHMKFEPFGLVEYARSAFQMKLAGTRELSGELLDLSFERIRP